MLFKQKFSYITTAAVLILVGLKGMTVITPVQGDVMTTKGSMPTQSKLYEAIEAPQPPLLDGIPDEPIWQEAQSDSLAFLWTGQHSGMPTPEDLSVSFKAVWNDSTNRLYLAVQAQDDTICDHFADPKERYYQDDGVEVFLDPDHSGGNHRNNYSAFAYHVSLFGDAIDLGESGVVNLKDHIRLGLGEDKRTWEIEFMLYTVYSHDGDSSNDELLDIEPGEVIGFSIAYNDNDGTPGVRESMMGWVPGAADSWIDADLFGDLKFVRGAVHTEEANNSTTAPSAFTLSQNYPNPFNAQTIVRYYLRKPAAVRLSVYNVTGQLVRTLVDGVRSSGSCPVTWDGRDSAGRDMASGVYLCRLEVNGQYVQTRRMVLLR